MDVLGIDIGGSMIKSATVQIETGRLSAEPLRTLTPQPATPETVTDAIAAIRQHFDWNGPIGCGFPAVIKDGIVCTAANIDKSWIGSDIVSTMRARTGLSVSVINDADAAGNAEMRFGAGTGQTGTVLMVTAGTGLGTSLFHRGILFPNTELGHLQFNGQIAEHFTAASVKERQRLTYREWAQRFDAYLHYLEGLFWPDLFIIGGEICKQHSEFMPYLTVKTRVVPALLRNEAGIIGAALSATTTG